MRNKRRQQTQTDYAGTETGSVTYTVTFFPDIFDSDKAIVEHLESLVKAKQSSAWLRNAVLGNGGVPQIRSVEKIEPVKPSIHVEAHSSVAQKAAEGMGLKFGKR